MIIISGNSNIQLAKKIADNLNCECIIAKTSYFPDGELNVKLEEQIAGEEIVIVQSLSYPVNDYIIELLLIIALVKKSGVKPIKLIIPYMAYARQNHNLFSPIEVIIRAIEATEIDEIFTLDLHSKEIEKLFKAKVVNISSVDIFIPYIQENFGDPIIVSPDIGSKARAEELAKKLGCNYAVINKLRKASSMEMNLIEGEVNNKHCIIIDDIVDSANTLCYATEFLIKHSALSVGAFITHPVLSLNAIERIKNSPLECIIVTDSIMNPNLPEKFKLVSSARQFSNLI